MKGSVDPDVRAALANVHEEVLNKFYGCGSPIPPLLQGRTILDLGCGSGRDVFVMAQLAGPTGSIIGVDMTEEQLAVARRHEDWHRQRFGFPRPTTSFRTAHIEDLRQAGVEDGTVDVVTSNCVINLCPDKLLVLREVARVLRPGGEFFFSDLYSDRRIPSHLKQDKLLLGEGLSGATYVEDFRRCMAEVGLPAWGVCSARRIAIDKPFLAEQVGPIQYFSLTVRAIKLAAGEGEDLPEDYGQTATYNGSLPSSPAAFELDEARRFPAQQPVPVDATTAAMLQQSRYAALFAVTERGAHAGAFTKWKHWPASVAGSWLLAEGVRGKAEKPSCC